MCVYTSFAINDLMFNPQYKALLATCLLMGIVLYLAPAGLGQSSNQSNPQTGTAPALGQSDWQSLNQVPNQQYQPNQSLGQSEWQESTGNAPGYSQPPGLTTNPANTMTQTSYGQASGGVPNSGQNQWQNPGMNQYQANSQPAGQSAWQNNSSSNPNPGLSSWQQPQNTVQANVNQNPNSQQNSDYYYGQINQNQQNPYAFNNGQYQGQANYSGQPNNNQWSNNLPPAASVPPQQTPEQPSQGGGLKKTLAGIAKAAGQAAGMGMGVAAPFAGVYMMSKAMSNTTPTYGVPTMPYGYGGYPGMTTMMPYTAPNYAMMNMAPMYSSAFSGLSSFMTH